MQHGPEMRFSYRPDADILEIGLGADVETRAVPLDDQTYVHLHAETNGIVGLTTINFAARFGDA